MSTRIIAEIGSTHDGKKDECLNAIKSAADVGIHDVKFQLLEDYHLKSGNIPLSKDWLPDLIEYGNENRVNVFASCWSSSSLNTLKMAGAKTVKIAYSANENIDLVTEACYLFTEVIISGDIMHYVGIGIDLFCIPQYPIYHKINFDGLFPPFHGFSDHTLGIRQSMKAITEGARIIEKHVCQCPNSPCPDAKFAISWDQMKSLVKFSEGVA